MPELSIALLAASVARSSIFSSLITCLDLIPVLGIIHSSLVSRNSDSMSLVTI